MVKRWLANHVFALNREREKEREKERKRKRERERERERKRESREDLLGLGLRQILYL